jgi:hypothetical protein
MDLAAIRKIAGRDNWSDRKVEAGKAASKQASGSAWSEKKNAFKQRAWKGKIQAPPPGGLTSLSQTPSQMPSVFLRLQ